MEAPPPTRIVHVDMDAFFASVEQRDNPALRGRPVVVGGTPEGRGVVAAASYEARRFGIRSAMPAARARRLCPGAVFVRPRMERYREVSRAIRAIFHEVTDLVEPLSLDEAYLDVTVNRLQEPLAGRVARWLKGRIRDQLDLTASAGVGPNKLVAKIASDLRKPDGLVIIPPDQVEDFLAPLPVGRLWGVGPRTRDRLHAMSIRTVDQLRRCDEALLSERFGKQGALLARQSWGDDRRCVTPHRERRSVGSERTFAEDVLCLDTLDGVLQAQCEGLQPRIEGLGVRARTVTVKLRYGDFTTITRSRSPSIPMCHASEFLQVARGLLREGTEAGAREVRLLGVSLSGLTALDAEKQLVLPLGD